MKTNNPKIVKTNWSQFRMITKSQQISKTEFEIAMNLVKCVQIYYVINFNTRIKHHSVQFRFATRKIKKL